MAYPRKCPVRPPPISANTKTHKYELLLVTILYSIVTVLFFAPSLSSLKHSLIGPPEDNMQHLWDFWWFNKALFDKEASLSFSNFIFYPQGSSLLFHAFSFFNLFLSLPLKICFGYVAIYNLLILSGFILSGLGAFLLIRYLTQNSFVSFICGFIFAFNPSHFARSLHNIELASIQFIPLFVLYFIKAIKDNTRKSLFLASVFFLLNGACSLYYLVLTIFFVFFVYLYLAFKRRKVLLFDILVKSTAVILPTIIILMPWLAKMFALGLRYPLELRRYGHNSFVVDLLALVIPHPQHLLAHIDILKTINGRFSGNPWEATAYLGTANIFMVALAFKRIRKKAARYFLAGAAFLVLAMGTNLHILGRSTPIILPHKLIQHISVLASMRAPSRAIVYVYLFFSIIVAFSLKEFFDKPTKCNARMKKACTFLVIAAIFLDYYSMCKTTTRVYLPKAYNAIKTEKGIFGILDLPTNSPRQYMMYQSLHGFPIVAGQISHCIGRPFIDPADMHNLSRQKEQLRENKVKYIVIHRYLIPHGQLDFIFFRYQLYYQLWYRDRENVIFKVY